MAPSAIVLIKNKLCPGLSNDGNVKHTALALHQREVHSKVLPYNDAMVGPVRINQRMLAVDSFPEGS